MAMWKSLKVKALLLITALWLTACARSERELYVTDWETYKRSFVASDGRVVDTGNQGISHSEGQGYGLLLALAADDRETFDRIWQWTKANLQVREDRLFRWRRRPDVPSASEDPNNATDGDLLIAWALLRAGEKWRRSEFHDAAWGVLADVRSKLVRHWRGMSVLLPGAQGFEHEGRLTVNLSYWVFPALRHFARADKQPEVWTELGDSGRRLVAEARFGRWGLPPDWLALSEPLTPSERFKPQFGYDAVRIPLYLAWGRESAEMLRPFLTFWGAFGPFTPAWTHLRENCMDGDGAPAGMRSIKALVQRVSGSALERWPETAAGEDYYSSSLRLLSLLASMETR